MNALELFRKYIDHKWNIGFFTFDEDVLIPHESHIHWLRHSYKDRWFADPFILEIDENFIYVLVEEFLDKKRMGRISKLIVDRRTFDLKEIIPVLELPTHLSFPALLRYKEKIYLYPENSASGSLYIYEFTESGLILWMEIKEPLTDSVIIEYHEKLYILSTKKPKPNGNKLYIGELDVENKSCKWIDTYSFTGNIARNAGVPFIYKDFLLKPSQDCNDTYGKGIIFQQMGFRNDEIVFVEMWRYYLKGKGITGFHTFNCYEGVVVVDIRMYRMPHVAFLLLGTRGLLLKLKWWIKNIFSLYKRCIAIILLSFI